MLFDVYGENVISQQTGWVMTFVGLIVMNEIVRCPKWGGVFCFLVAPTILTVYFVAIYVSAIMGAGWALNDPTYVRMGSWFHYAKLYVATAGCIGFMVLKHHQGSLGKTHWSKCFPSVIVAINILIAVTSDLESAIRAWGTTSASAKGITLMGGWYNVLNGIAGLLNTLRTMGRFGIYASKGNKDVLRPDMTWVFIVFYDPWNFCHTYNCLPTHARYRGLALLLAPTVANASWNKDGWTQNQANTLMIWRMFVQVASALQDYSVFSTDSANNPQVNLWVSLVALVANILASGYILHYAKQQGVNPWLYEVFKDTRDFEQIMSRRMTAAKAA